MDISEGNCRVELLLVFDSILNKNFFALIILKEATKIEMSQNQIRSFEQHIITGEASNEVENQNSSNMCSQFLTQEGKCYGMYLPNYEIDRRALSLSFGTYSSRRACNNYQSRFIDSDGIPTLSDLVSITDRHESEYSSLQRHYSSSPEKVNPQLKCLKVTVQLEGDKSSSNKKGERFTLLQGDEIKGFITISNSSNMKLPYTACLVTLVGYISLKSDNQFNLKHKKEIIHRFLSMVDYDASNSLSSSDGNGSAFATDAENSYLLKGNRRIFLEPSASCRKFFKFRLPEHLVNYACPVQNLQQHCELLPTFDFCPKPGSVLLNWFKKGLNSIGNDSREDKRLGCPASEASISYCIEAKIIGEISDYQEYLYTKYRAIEKKVLTRLINIDKTFVTLNVLPRSNLAHLGQELFADQCKEIYNDLQERAKKKLYSNQKKKPIEKLVSVSKNQQLYKDDKNGSSAATHTLGETINSDAKIPTDLFSTVSNSLGTIRITMPAMLLNISPSLRYMYSNTDNVSLPQYTLKFPINLEFSSNCLDKNHKFPKLTNVSFELVALTFISRTTPIPIPIPIVINYDILFGEKKITDDINFDPFEERIRKPFRSLLSKMDTALRKNEGSQLISDLRCLTNLEYKYERMPVEDNSNTGISKVVLSTPWERSSSEDCKNFKKTIHIDINATGIKHTLEKLHWVPQFQSCFVGRMYFCKIKLKMRSAHDIAINLPLYIMENKSTF